LGIVSWRDSYRLGARGGRCARQGRRCCVSEASAAYTWFVARYAPVSVFSLRSTYATSKGGKTLLIPTPYAVKMALIDACFRTQPRGAAEAAARRVFDLIKAQPVRIRPPAECLVQNTFMRALQPERTSDDDDATGPFTRTIAYREFVFFSGEMELAFGLSGLDDSAGAELGSLPAHINYF